MRLSTKLLGSILSLLLLGMGASSYYSYLKSEAAIESALHSRSTMTVQGVSRELEAALAMTRQEMIIAGQHPIIQEVLNSSLPEARRKQAQQDGVNVLLSVCNVTGYIDTLQVLDTQGVVVSSSQADAIGGSRADRGYFKEILATGKPTGAGPLKARATGRLGYIAVEPVTKDGKLIGVLIATLDIGFLEKNSVAPVKFGNSGYVFLATPQGQMFIHPNDALIFKDNYSNAPWHKAAMANTSGTISYMDPDGIEKEGVFVRMPSTNWIVMGTANKADLYAELHEIRNSSIISTISVLLCIALVIIIIVRGITKDLNKGVNFAEAVASGELDRKLDVVRKDELGTLSNALRSMVSNIRTMIGTAEAKTEEAKTATDLAEAATEQARQAQAAAESAKHEGMLDAANKLEHVVDVVSSASTQLAAQIEQSEKGSAHQAARVSETATAMEQMNATVLEVARAASNAADVSRATRTKAEEGAAVVEDVLKSVQKVRQDSLMLRDDMAVLNDHAQAISQIMGVISDIADQTNLLALNAAIEAARAGEAGRGFAVVADEVRKLAEKTMASTSEVGNAIHAIQQSTDKSVHQVDEAVHDIESTTQEAEKAGTALREIVRLVDSTGDQVRSIATACEQQSASSEAITQSISEVNHIATETSRAMQEASQAVADLSTQSHVLVRLIEEMKTE